MVSQYTNRPGASFDKGDGFLTNAEKIELLEAKIRTLELLVERLEARPTQVTYVHPTYPQPQQYFYPLPQTYPRFTWGQGTLIAGGQTYSTGLSQGSLNTVPAQGGGSTNPDG